MVTVSNEPNAWDEVELQKSDIDEETETCVGVRIISRRRASSNLHRSKI